MSRFLATTGLVLGGLAAAGSVLAQSATPTPGVYQGSLFVTAVSSGCSTSQDPSVGGVSTARLNYQSGGAIDFALFNNKHAVQAAVPATASGTLSFTEIGSDGTVKQNGTALAYAGQAVTVLDPSTNAISYTIQITLPDSCQLTFNGALALLP